VHIWKVPGLTPAGADCGRTVDFLNIYPTLCALAGLPRPAHLEGHDITPLLKKPKAEWSYPAVTTHGYQNHAVRNEEWRYIRYADGSEELYHNLMDQFEWNNLASRPEYARQKEEMAKWLPKVNKDPLSSLKKNSEKTTKKEKRKAKKNK